MRSSTEILTLLLRDRFAKSSIVWDASSFPCFLYSAPKCFSVVLRVELNTNQNNANISKVQYDFSSAYIIYYQCSSDTSLNSSGSFAFINDVQTQNSHLDNDKNVFNNLNMNWMNAVVPFTKATVLALQ